MKKLSILCFVALFIGCTPHNDPTIMSNNKAVLAGDGETVGTLPDGRRVVRYRLDMGSEIKDHWVYVVDNTITINRTELHGKISSNHVDVIVNGVTYQPVKNNEDN